MHRNPGVFQSTKNPKPIPEVAESILLLRLETGAPSDLATHLRPSMSGIATSWGLGPRRASPARCKRLSLSMFWDSGLTLEPTEPDGAARRSVQQSRSYQNFHLFRALSSLSHSRACGWQKRVGRTANAVGPKRPESWAKTLQ